MLQGFACFDTCAWNILILVTVQMSESSGSDSSNHPGDDSDGEGSVASPHASAMLDTAGSRKRVAVQCTANPPNSEPGVPVPRWGKRTWFVL